MEKVYIKTKKGKIFECYVSEQMNKPIYYPTESKTNGYIDYYDVERFLEIDSMYKEVKQLQQENIDLKKQCNFGGITIVKCPECDKKINVNFCRETEEYRQRYLKLQQENTQLKQEKEELIKWLQQEYMCFDNESDECMIARQILSKLKESDGNE